MLIWAWSLNLSSILNGQKKYTNVDSSTLLILPLKFLISNLKLQTSIFLFGVSRKSYTHLRRHPGIITHQLNIGF